MQKPETDILGELILIDSDQFEYELLKEVLHRLRYNVALVYFPTAGEGLDYLSKTKNEIFLVISELHFPGMSGYQLKQAINEVDETRWLSVPFIFIANSATKMDIDEAYKQNIHGIFKKPKQMKDLTHMFSVIIEYWMMNLHPHKSLHFYSDY